MPVLATSGIESLVRLWSPEGPADMSDCSAAILSNQQRMQDGPQLLRGINPAVIQVGPLLSEPQSIFQVSSQSSRIIPSPHLRQDLTPKALRKAMSTHKILVPPRWWGNATGHGSMDRIEGT